MSKLQIMDTTIRDAHQSLWATRMQVGEILPVLTKMDAVGYWAIEAWGGATFDTSLRFLDENPWERLRAIKKYCLSTPLSMLVRGQNLVGYHHYSQEIVQRFIEASHRNGIDVFRVFDALNDIRNVTDCAAAIKQVGAHFEPAIAYTVSPIHTLDSYIDYALELKELGADSICIKDMAGMLTPYRTERLIKALVENVGVPIHLHCHYVGGMAPANYIKAAEAGVSIVDTATAPLAFGNSQPAIEMIAAALKESIYDTGFDLDLLFEIAEYWEDVRIRSKHKRGVSSLLHMQVYSHQVPGGMMSNLISQLELQNAKDRLPDVLKEIPIVRAEVGFPPLVTPMSQIVATQSVLNVLTGKRWTTVSTEMKDYLAGYYGRPPGKLDSSVRDRVLKDTQPLDPTIAPSSLVTTTYDEVAVEIGNLAQSEEDVLMYALFPNEARLYLEKHQSESETTFVTEFDPMLAREETEMDLNQIKELISVVENSDVDEVTVEEAGTKITVRGKGAGAAAGSTSLSANPSQPSIISDNATSPISLPEVDPDADMPGNYVAVKSPMVGTFYAAPGPDKPSFVVEGDSFTAGQTLCIVEAMKLMNEVVAEQMGTVKSVRVDNAAAVEYGTTLFWIEPTTNNV